LAVTAAPVCPVMLLMRCRGSHVRQQAAEAEDKSAAFG
jgi:hypothetical protein